MTHLALPERLSSSQPTRAQLPVVVLLAPEGRECVPAVRGHTPATSRLPACATTSWRRHAPPGPLTPPLPCPSRAHPPERSRRRRSLLPCPEPPPHLSDMPRGSATVAYAPPVDSRDSRRRRMPSSPSSSTSGTRARLRSIRRRQDLPELADLPYVIVVSFCSQPLSPPTQFFPLTPLATAAEARRRRVMSLSRPELPPPTFERVAILTMLPGAECMH